MSSCDSSDGANHAPVLMRKIREFQDDETGSFIVFCLFLFVTILFMGGMAVDLMRLDTKRVEAQNTLDGAILAASSMTQKEDAEALVKDHFAKAGFSPDEVVVKGEDDLLNDKTLVGRSVKAKTNLKIDTFFMNLLGIDELQSGVEGRAAEAVQNVEISLILDVSGSMGDNSRLDNLKIAAKNFIDKVYLNTPPGSLTSVSIVPYNHTVVVGNDLLKHLNAGGSTVPIPSPLKYTGSLTEYPTQHNLATCIRFQDDDFKSREISDATVLDRMGFFDIGSNDYDRPTKGKRWCNENRASIMVHETDPLKLKTKIDSLRDGGWTGIDNGMKWGVALLDPALEPALADMIIDETLDAKVSGRPAQYDADKTMKVAIVMTDGDNTLQRDLKVEFKRGPSRIWKANSRTSGSTDELGKLSRDLTEFDGYFVLMPDNSASERFYVPGSPTTDGDDFFISAAELPDDAVQQTYQQLHARFAEDDIASFFFEEVDKPAYDAHRDAWEEHDVEAEIDDRLQDICDKALEGSRIRVFAIGFEAPDKGQTAMQNCARLSGNYFPAKGKEGINRAFDSIAGQISMLRLKE